MPAGDAGLVCVSPDADAGFEDAGSPDGVVEEDDATAPDDADSQDGDCEDGAQNGDEQGVDCGGRCAACVGDDGSIDAGSGDAEPMDGSTTDPEDADAADGALAMGGACTDGSQCASGHCSSSDGVCCDLSCAGACLACVESKTGYADGICAPVIARTDPDMECAAAAPATCGSSGAGCNGSAVTPGCLLYEADAVCVPQHCAASAVTATRTCDGRGTCRPQPAASCGAYACAPSGDVCLTTCSSDASCIGGYTCDSNHACVLANSGAEIVWVKVWEAQFDLDGVGITYLALRTDSSGGAVFSANCPGPIPGLICGGAGGGAHKLDALGNKLWSRNLDVRLSGISLAIAPDDALIVERGNSWLGGCCNTTLESYSSDGQSRWSRRFGNFDFRVEPSWVTSDGQSSVFARITANTAVDYGDGVPVAGNRLIKYNAAGQLLWTRAWSASEPMLGDVSGNLVAIAPASSAAGFGCAAAIGSEVYLAKVNASGDCAWGKAFGGTLASGAVDTDASGNIVLAATVSGAVNFGLGSLPAIGATDLVLAKFDPAGTPLWNARFGGPGFGGGVAIDVAPNGQILIGGGFSGTLDLGGGPLLATAGSTFLAKFSALGQLLGQFQFTGGMAGMAIDPGGDAWVLSTGADLNFGAGKVFTTRGLAVAKLRL